MVRTFLSLLTAAALAASPAMAQGGFLGVSLEPAPAGSVGARIASVQERSAATVMGLQQGDLVTAVDGVNVADASALAQLIGRRLPGDMVELKVQRGSQELSLLGVLARRPGAGRSSAEEAEEGRLFMPPGAGGRQSLRLEIPNFQFQDMDFPDFQLDLKDWDDLQPQLQDLGPRMEELQQRLQGLEQHHAELMRQLHERLQGLGGDGDDAFTLQFEGAPGGLFLHPGEPLKADANTQIKLRYPESTSPEERERLTREAHEKYGEGAQVEFAGTGTAVIIQRQVTTHAEGAPADAVPPRPPQGKRDF